MPEVHPQDQLLTVREAVDCGRSSRSTLYRYLKSGQLTSVRIGGRRYVRMSDLQAFIDSHVEQGWSS